MSKEMPEIKADKKPPKRNILKKVGIVLGLGAAGGVGLEAANTGTKRIVEQKILEAGKASGRIRSSYNREMKKVKRNEAKSIEELRASMVDNVGFDEDRLKYGNFFAYFDKNLSEEYEHSIYKDGDEVKIQIRRILSPAEMRESYESDKDEVVIGSLSLDANGNYKIISITDGEIKTVGESDLKETLDEIWERKNK